MSFCTKGIHARSCRIHCFKKRRKTFSLGRRCPSGQIRVGGKCFSRNLTHRLRRPPSRRARVIPWTMDSATPPCGCTQNDRIAGGTKFHMTMKGIISPVPVEQFLLTWHYLFVRGTKMGGKVCYRAFPIIMCDCSLDLPN